MPAFTPKGHIPGPKLNEDANNVKTCLRIDRYLYSNLRMVATVSRKTMQTVLNESIRLYIDKWNKETAKRTK